jgi:hypothetical protein
MEVLSHLTQNLQLNVLMQKSSELLTNVLRRSLNFWNQNATQLKGRSCNEVTVCRLAEDLLEKESINLPQIIKILGERPFPMKQAIKDYLSEIENREKQEAEQAAKDAAEDQQEDAASQETK